MHHSYWTEGKIDLDVLRSQARDRLKHPRHKEETVIHLHPHREGVLDNYAVDDEATEGHELYTFTGVRLPRKQHPPKVQAKLLVDLREAYHGNVAIVEGAPEGKVLKKSTAKILDRRSGGNFI